MPADEDFFTWLLSQVNDALVGVENGDASAWAYKNLVSQMEDRLAKAEAEEKTKQEGDPRLEEDAYPGREGWKADPTITVDVPMLREGSLGALNGLGSFCGLGDRVVFDPYIVIKRGENATYDEEVDAKLSQMFLGTGDRSPYLTATWDDFEHPILGRIVREDYDSSPVVHWDGTPAVRKGRAGLEYAGYMARCHIRPALPWEDKLECPKAYALAQEGRGPASQDRSRAFYQSKQAANGDVFDWDVEKGKKEDGRWDACMTHEGRLPIKFDSLPQAEREPSALPDLKGKDVAAKRKGTT